MNDSSIHTRLLAVINDVFRRRLTTEEFARASRVDELVDVDSLTLINFVMGVEEEFGVDLIAEEHDREFFMNIDRLARRLTAR